MSAHGWKVGESVYCGWCADLDGAEEIEAPEEARCAECGAVVKGDEWIEADECSHGRFPDDCDDCIRAARERPPFCPVCHGAHAPYCQPEDDR